MPVFQTGVEGALPSCPSIFGGRTRSEKFMSGSGAVPTAKEPLPVAIFLRLFSTLPWLNYQSAALRTRRLQVGPLPGAPAFAALAQLPEALRSERRGWGWKSLTRYQSSLVALRLGRPFAHVVQCRDGALKTRPVSVRVRPWAPTACRPIRRDVPLKTERLQVRVLPRGLLSRIPFVLELSLSITNRTRAILIWSVNRTSAPDLFARQRAPRKGRVVQVHGTPPAFAGGPSARSAERAGGFKSRIALDQCRDPERHRMCASIPVEQKATKGTKSSARSPPFPTFASVTIPSGRSRASAQVGFISPLGPGQHRRLRGISMPATLLSAAACGLLSKAIWPGQHRPSPVELRPGRPNSRSRSHSRPAPDF